MRPPTLFKGQPLWASLIVIALYVVAGPWMRDQGPAIERPPPAISDRTVVVLGWLFFALCSFLAFRVVVPNALGAAILSLCLACALTVLAFGKSLVRVAVNAYQRRAPAEVRRLCGRTPTCSQYLMISVEKHGLLRGVRKGWRRLSRCDGTASEDWP